MLEDKLVARCVLPPFSAADGSVEYKLSYRLDGHYNERDSEVVPIVATPLTSPITRSSYSLIRIRSSRCCHFFTRSSFASTSASVHSKRP